MSRLPFVKAEIFGPAAVDLFRGQPEGREWVKPRLRDLRHSNKFLALFIKKMARTSRDSVAVATACLVLLKIIESQLEANELNE